MAVLLLFWCKVITHDGYECKIIFCFLNNHGGVGYKREQRLTVSMES